MLGLGPTKFGSHHRLHRRSHRRQIEDLPFPSTLITRAHRQLCYLILVEVDYTKESTTNVEVVPLCMSLLVFVLSPLLLS